MNFLIDVQLPPKLAHWIQSMGHSARHAVEIPDGLTLSDDNLWKIAAGSEEVIVTKDSDFFDKSLLENTPPKIFLINIGSCKNADLLALLEVHWGRIVSLLETECRLISLSSTEITVFD